MPKSGDYFYEWSVLRLCLGTFRGAVSLRILRAVLMMKAGKKLIEASDRALRGDR